MTIARRSASLRVPTLHAGGLTALSALAVLALLAVPTRAGVLVVDASGGGEFTSLPQALVFAQDGDTLFVRPGNYIVPVSPLNVVDRSLTIAGDGTGPVLTGPIRVIQNVPGKRVVLRNLVASAQQYGNLLEGLTVQGGDVLAEECSFQGHDGQVSIGGTPGSPGALVNAGHLVLVRCTVTGGRGADTFFPYIPNGTRGGYGVQTFARVSIYGSTILGGDGGNFVGFGGAQGTGGVGGSGVVGENCSVFLGGSTTQGGDAGGGDLITQSPLDYAGGDGGTMIGACDLRVIGTLFVGGAGGQIAGGGIGQTGSSLNAIFSTVIEYPGPYRSYQLGPATPEGSSVQLDYAGVQGDLVLLFVALSPAGAPLPGKQGVWHLGSPLLGPYLFGPVSAADGTLSLSILVPAGGLTPDVAVLLYEQAFVKPANGPALLSSPSTHLVVDDHLW